MLTTTNARRVATYERVSSDDQALRQTIKTQTDELARSLAGDPNVELVGRYVDDGVSGTIPLAEREGGGQLLRDAAARRFDELQVYKFDRLGRDAVDLLVVRRRFMELGIRVRSVVEGEPDLLGYDVQAVVADHARREFLRRSADGMARAAREGRYTGGIVPFGYVVGGRKETARLVPDERLVAPGLTAADAVRLLYRRLGIDGHSCRRIAAEFNELGVLTHYARDGRLVWRGERHERTQAQWRTGRIRNMAVNPVYRGELSFGRRSATAREVIRGSVAPLVAGDLWQAAQDGLAARGICPRDRTSSYLLRGLIRCGSCGLSYVGSAGRSGVAWYRCNGRHSDRGPFLGACPAGAVRADVIESLAWREVERRMTMRSDEPPGAAEAAAETPARQEAARIAAALAALDEQRLRVTALHIRGLLSAEEFDVNRTRLARERAALERRSEALALMAAAGDSGDQPGPDLEPMRARFESAVTPDDRRAVVRALMRVVVHTTTIKGARELRLEFEHVGAGARASAPPIHYARGKVTPSAPVAINQAKEMPR